MKLDDLRKYSTLVIVLNIPIWAFALYVMFVGTYMSGLVLGCTAMLNCAAALGKPAVVKQTEAMIICLLMCVGNLFFFYIGATLVLQEAGDRALLPGIWLGLASAFGVWDVLIYKNRIKNTA